ncbi:menaquinone biosynthesis family protein [Pedobacter sp. MC2016-24]|uniref:menaquinone biosynthesis family protein n=1 Tax=Pedobacter sp. MC2016-24 TaxID=2780090 RepID=UPI001882C14E|nr:1,4-dihydroxy-6-naphthoate synthase [Pedobacter sp. MC2016-24]MBE9600515.1 1,4-dihydroxy-6-naphthoate synthase [Pedobacter sp. MC2016-24]
MKLTLGFSPCPNDTFIFDALIHHKIDTEGLEFDVFFDDVETLNQKAFRSELDMTKLSFHAFAYMTGQYALLDSGSALGFGVGPLLISKNEYLANHHDHISADLRVGIPGKYTTANFLLGIAFPHLLQKQEMVFSEIEQSLLADQIDLGLIIHENRFTYMDKGLHKVMDLGNYWEQQTGCAIPLGGIVVNRRLDQETKEKINRVLRKSVEFAFANPKSGIDFIKQHAQEMSEEVMYKHIDLYVNQYSIELGKAGRKAIDVMFAMAEEKGLIQPTQQSIYLIP